MPIFSSSLDVVQKTKSFLASKFDMKDMGEASVILGVKIIKENDSIILSQEHYVEKLRKKFGHFDVNPMSTPYDVNTQLKRNKVDTIAQSEYA